MRSFLYTSVVGDDDRVRITPEAIWRRGFNPVVFKRRSRQGKAKSVDIALTKDMLSNAHFDNYDIAVLVAGDGDYVPLVDEVKRLGKVVMVSSFVGEGLGLSPDLKLSADYFFGLDAWFVREWQNYYSQNLQ